MLLNQISKDNAPEHKLPNGEAGQCSESYEFVNEKEATNVNFLVNKAQYTELEWISGYRFAVVYEAG
jgi:hypothetical protein